MKKRIFGGVIVIALATIIAMVGVFFPSNKKSANLSAYAEGFQYLFPGSPEEKDAGGKVTKEAEDGSIIIGSTTAGERTTHFNLHVLDTSGDPLVRDMITDGVGGSKITTPVHLPVFHKKDMREIANNINHTVDYGFVMIRPGEAVVLDITPAGRGLGPTRSWWKHDHGDKIYGGDGGKMHAATMSEEQVATTYGSLGKYALDGRRNNMVYFNSGGNQLAGAFDREGLHEFELECLAIGGNGQTFSFTLKFKFYIVHEIHYWDTFNANNVNAIPVLTGGTYDYPTRYTWGAEGRFFYNYTTPMPFIRYSETRFAVNVIAFDHLGLEDHNFVATKRERLDNTNAKKDDMYGYSQDTPGVFDYGTYNKSTRFSQWDFVKLGTYRIEANVVYWDAKINKLITTTNHFTQHAYSFNVFGLQAHYQNYMVCNGAETCTNPKSGDTVLCDHNPYSQRLFGGEVDANKNIHGANITNNLRRVDGTGNIVSVDTRTGHLPMNTLLQCLDNHNNICKLPAQTHPTHNQDCVLQCTDPNHTHNEFCAISIDLYTPEQISALIGTGGPGSIVPAVTNAPPVTVVGNVHSDRHVYFKPVNGEWDISRNLSDYRSNALYERPGEYFIVVSYTHPLASQSFTTPRDRNHEYYQVFYFKINNFIDARVQYQNSQGTTVNHYFNHYISNNSLALNGSQSWVVFLQNNANNPEDFMGPYELKPQIYLTHYNWQGTPTNIPIITEINGRIRIGTSAIPTPSDGIFRFRVYYGNLYLSRFDFAILVDNEQMRGLSFTDRGGLGLRGLIGNRTSDLNNPDCELPTPLNINTTVNPQYISNFHNFEIFGNTDPLHEGASNRPIIVGWQNKQSENLPPNFLEDFGNVHGVATYAKAHVRHYGFIYDTYYFKEDVGLFYEMQDKTPNSNLYSPYILNIRADAPIDTYDVIQLKSQSGANIGWQIADPRADNNQRRPYEFTEGGLYVIEIEDTIGNRSSFGFMIDNTKAGFAQSIRPNFDNNEPNIVNEPTVHVGFGNNKLIRATNISTAFTGQLTAFYEWLDGLEIMVGGVRQRLLHSDNMGTDNPDDDLLSIRIPMGSRHFSDDNEDFRELRATGAINPGTVEYNAATSVLSFVTPTGQDIKEGFYFLKSADVLGNAADWYVWVNPDHSRGMILQDPNPGLIGISDRSGLILPEGMITLDYVYFSFRTASDKETAEIPSFQPGLDDKGNPIPNVGSKYIVDFVEWQFWPFDFSQSHLENPNYPFSPVGSQPRVLYENKDNYSTVCITPLCPHINTANCDNPLHPKNSNPRTEFFPINHLPELPGTAPGLYKISRYYDLRWHDDNDAAYKQQVKNYFFIVDRNRVIPLDGRPWESDVKVHFEGTGGKTATYRNYYATIETNANMTLMMPEYITKYGATNVLGVDNFEGPITNKTGQKVKTPTSLVKTTNTEIFNETKNENINFTNNGTQYQSKSMKSLLLKTDYLYGRDLDRNGNIMNSRQYRENRDFNFTNERYTFPLGPNGKALAGHYKMNFRDGSGGINWLPYAQHNFDVDTQRTNRSEVNIHNLGGDSMNASWILNDEELLPNITLPDIRYTRLSESDNLQFYFVNDEDDFFAPIDVNSIVITIGNDTTNIAPIVPRDPAYCAQGCNTMLTCHSSHGTRDPSGSRVLYTYTFTPDQIRQILRLPQRQFVRIELFSEATGLIRYDLEVDNTPPQYNLSNIMRNTDTLGDRAYTSPFQFSPNYMADGTPTQKGYVYSISNKYSFIYSIFSTFGPQETDTYRIEYQEVDSDLVALTGGFRPLQNNSNYHNNGGFGYNFPPADPNTNQDAWFSNQIMPKLQPDEMRYFLIRETDRAGNRQEYYVRLRGDQYQNTITVRGQKDGSPQSNFNLLSGSSYESLNATKQFFGTNLTLNDVTAFYSANPSFIFEYTIGQSTSVNPFIRHRHIESNPPVTVNDFYDYIQKMLRAAENSIVNVTYRDGFGPMYHRISQVGANTPLPILTVAPTGPQDALSISIDNFATLNSALPGNKFTLRIYQIVNGRADRSNPTTIDLPNGREEQFRTFATNRELLVNTNNTNYVNGQFIIEVRDSYGREKIDEWHGIGGAVRDVNYNYNSRSVRTSMFVRGVRYVGHEDGVRITWDDNAYELHINNLPFGTSIGEDENNRKDDDVRARTRETLELNNVVTYRVGTRIISQLTIKPKEGFNDMSSWEVRFRFRASEVDAAVEQWNFYYVLPDLSFRNINGMNVEAEVALGAVKGMVEVRLDKSNMKIEGVTIGSWVNYTRTWYDNEGIEMTEPTSINRFTSYFVLDKAGFHVITVTTDVGTIREYRFDVSEVDNLTFKIYHKGRQLESSPEFFEYDNIKSSVIDPFGFVQTFCDRGDTNCLPSCPYRKPNDAPTAAEKRRIPVFWVSSAWTNTSALRIDTTNFDNGIYKSVNGEIELVPSMNNRRRLVHIESGSNSTNASWHYYYLYSEDTGNRMYFVVAQTGVMTTSRLQRISQISSDDQNTYRLFRYIENGFITVELEQRSPTQQNQSIITPAMTNLYYIDYFQNGIYGGRLFHGQQLRIQEHDYGKIDLYIYDWARNMQTFQDSPTATVQDFFTIYNLSQPPLLINGETIVNEMVYNNELKIEVLAIGSNVGQSNSAFYVSAMKVYRDGELVQDYSAGSKRDFGTMRFTDSGRYVIETEYNTGTDARRSGTGPNNSIVVKSLHIVQLVNPEQLLAAWTFSGATNINIVAVRYGSQRIDISRNFGIIADTNGNVAPVPNMTLNSNNGNGVYHVTFEIDASNVRESFRVTRQIHILALGQTDANLVYATKAFGRRHGGTVNIIFNPQQIFWAANGAAEITILQDGAVKDVYGVTAGQIAMNGTTYMADRETPWNIEDDIELAFSNGGKYQIIVTASDGTIIFADGFAIQGAANSTMYMLGVIGGIILVGIILLALRMRSKMRVK